MSTFSPSSSSRKRSSDTPIAAHSCTTTAGSKTRLRVRIKKFHGVAKWTWNVGNGSDDEVCGICQSAFEGCPPGVKFPGDESPVVFGTCGEFFFLLFLFLVMFVFFHLHGQLTNYLSVDLFVKLQVTPFICNAWPPGSTPTSRRVRSAVPTGNMGIPVTGREATQIMLVVLQRVEGNE